jgi:EAL domain-containing protein (putative c-di-GMP-specific phosphodiesterase class I)
LARWTHPTRGFISPTQFIAIAEEAASIVELDHWVLRRACRQWVTWSQRSVPLQALTMNVNVSALTLVGPQFLTFVRSLPMDTGIDLRRLRLEITETALMGNVEATLFGLRELGICLALDDFGIGYSSLSYLHRLPVDTIKIDRSFVGQLGTPRGDTMVKTIIAIAQQLGLDTVAEGIETEQQKEILAQFGCHLGQGFMFHRPADASAAETEQLLGLTSG